MKMCVISAGIFHPFRRSCIDPITSNACDEVHAFARDDLMSHYVFVDLAFSSQYPFKIASQQAIFTNQGLLTPAQMRAPALSAGALSPVE